MVQPFFGSGTPDYVEACLSPEAIKDAGIWQAQPVASLVAKCRRTGGKAMSNTDDMAFCAILSTQLIARDLIQGSRVVSAGDDTSGRLGVDVDRVRDAAG